MENYITIDFDEPKRSVCLNLSQILHVTFLEDGEKYVVRIEFLTGEPYRFRYDREEAAKELYLNIVKALTINTNLIKY